jgi:hypothetical protein
LTDTLAAATQHGNDLDVTVPGATGGGTGLATARTYRSVEDIQHEPVDARVWIGFTSATPSSRARSSATRSPTGTSRKTFQPLPPAPPAQPHP